jgi:hypothetical protein
VGDGWIFGVVMVCNGMGNVNGGKGGSVHVYACDPLLLL